MPFHMCVLERIAFGSLENYQPQPFCKHSGDSVHADSTIMSDNAKTFKFAQKVVRYEKVHQFLSIIRYPGSLLWKCPMVGGGYWERKHLGAPL